MYTGMIWFQCVSPPANVAASAGPIARAGLSDAAVIGPSTMMIATTTPPITRPAKSPGERASTIPRIANIRSPVPMNSAKMAEPQLYVSSLKDACPRPMSTPVCVNSAQIPSAPSVPPTSCAPM